MIPESQDDLTIPELQQGDLIGHRQQPDDIAYEVLTVTEKQILAASTKSNLALRIIASQDIAPPF